MAAMGNPTPQGGELDAEIAGTSRCSAECPPPGTLPPTTGNVAIAPQVVPISERSVAKLARRRTLGKAGFAKSQNKHHGPQTDPAAAFVVCLRISGALKGWKSFVFQPLSRFRRRSMDEARDISRVLLIYGIDRCVSCGQHRPFMDTARPGVSLLASQHEIGFITFASSCGDIAKPKTALFLSNRGLPVCCANWRRRTVSAPRLLQEHNQNP